MPSEETLLLCPICKAKLRYDADLIVCSDNTLHRFANSESIISFVADSEFDRHWKPHGNSPIPRSKILVATRFLAPILTTLTSSSKVLDVGCGDGVHAAVLDNAACCLGPAYIGLDASIQALRAAHTRKPGATWLHADAVTLPVQSNSMDACFSYGVVAYTPNPAIVVKEMARVTKPGGLVGLWVYPKPSGLKGALFLGIRKATALVGPKWTRVIADLIVPTLKFLPVASGVHLGNASWKQCREIVLVNIAPSNLMFPDDEEIRGWVVSAGLTTISEDARSPFTIWATK